MRITFDREVLLNALGKLSSIVKQRQTMPILSNVLVTIDRDDARICATDLEITATVIIDNDYPVTEPVKYLLTSAAKDIVAKLDKGELIIDFNGGKNGDTIILQGHSEFALPDISTEDYPAIEHHDDDPQVITIDGAELTKAIENVYYASATDESRYVLTGIALTVKDGKYTAVATDGYRMALYEGKLPGAADMQTIVIPRRAAKLLADVIGEKDIVAVSVDKDSKRASFATDTLIIETRLIQHKYPEYDDFLDKAMPYTITATRDIIAKSLKRVCVVADNSVRIETGNGAVTLHAESQLGRAKEVLPNKNATDELNYHFYPGQIIDAIVHMPGPSITVQFPQEYGGVVIMPENPAEDLRHVNLVMPVRMS